MNLFILITDFSNLVNNQALIFYFTFAVILNLITQLFYFFTISIYLIY